MKTKRFLSAVLCAMLLITLLPATTFAAGGTVKIGGAALSLSTPYYYNDGSIQPTATKNNDGVTHYNAYFDSANDTLHLCYLQVDSGETGGAIAVSGISTLYIELEDSTNNDVNCMSSDAGAVGINAPGTKLVIYGDGKLTVHAVNSTNGIGISASAIELQYPAELEAKGSERATSAPMTAISGTYAAKGGSDTSTPPTGTYNFTNSDTAKAYKFIIFNKLLSPLFPVWVNDAQITGDYTDGESLSGGTVTYTPARGATPAELTLDGVTVVRITARGNYRAGVYAESYPLRLCLKNSNTIEISAPEDSSVMPCGVYSEKALTVEAEPDASLTANISLTPGPLANPQPPCAMRADGGITLDGCAVLSPDGGRISADTKFISDSTGTAALGSVTIGVAVYGMTLSKTGTHTFASLTEGYTAAPAALDVTVTNSGNLPTGALDIELSGANAGDFTISKASIADIAKSGSDSFTVAPNASLGAGVHTATVTVKKAAANANAIAEQSFAVQFTVAAASAGTSVPTQYLVIKGQFGAWTGESGGLSFTADAPYAKFTGVSVDGVAIHTDNYTVQSGSTIVTLKASYLETLSVGRHTLRVNFTDGYAETTFTVNGYIDIPQTGDSATPALWLSTLLMAGAGLAVSVVIRRKRQNG